MFNNQGGSRRWTVFHSALQTAIQRSAHKWTFEDFSECFPLYVEEEKNGSSAVFNAISGHMESQTFKDFDELFMKYDVQRNIDTLHTIVNEAKERKENGIQGNDVWRDDLEPHAAVCARTMPVLDTEAKTLRERLAALEAENARLQAEIEENEAARDRANEESKKLLDNLDRLCAGWSRVLVNEIEEWAIQTMESTKTPQIP